MPRQRIYAIIFGRGFLGFGFWITREIKLWKLLVAFLASIFLTIIAGSLLTDTFQKIHPYIWSSVFLIAIAPLFTSMLALALASRYRMVHYIDNSPRLKNAIAIIVLAGILAFFAVNIVKSGLPNFSLADELKDFFRLMLIGVPVGIILFSAALLATYIWVKIPGKKKGSFAKASKTFFAALKAKKRKVCPLVEPPPEFQKK